MILKMKLVCLILLSSVLMGCATAKQYTPLPNENVRIENTDKARIYVVRPATIGCAIPMAIKDNGVIIGDTGGRSYLCWEREPGNVTITGKSENTSTVEFVAEKGQVYYVEQFVTIGFAIARNRLEVIDEENGQRLKAKCKPPQYVQPKQKVVKKQN